MVRGTTDGQIIRNHVPKLHRSQLSLCTQLRGSCDNSCLDRQRNQPSTTRKGLLTLTYYDRVVDFFAIVVDWVIFQLNSDIHTLLVPVQNVQNKVKRKSKIVIDNLRLKFIHLVHH